MGFGCPLGLWAAAKCFLTISAVVIVTSAVILTYIPFVSGLFGFAVPHPLTVIVAIVAGLIPAVGIEIKKRLSK